MSHYSRVQETVLTLRRRGIGKPSIGIILGTGLGSLARRIRVSKSLPFQDCPFFPKATSIGHAGRLIYGTLSGRRVLAMEGRFHLFEGHALREVAYPVWVMKGLGIRVLILSNAAGGLHPNYRLGDLMLISDHINLMGDSPLAGPNDDRLGPRFPDMSQPYDPRLMDLAERSARDLGLALRRGVYVGVKGPNLETRAEYRFLRLIGADAVGMSTIPEVIAAAHAGLRVMALSCITDLCHPDHLEPINIQKILATAKKAEPQLTQIVSEVVSRLK